MPSVPPDTSRATRLMLDRLKELSPAPVNGSVEATLLSVPEDRRERVLSVLEALDARAHDAKTDEALGEAARLVRNAARELWAKPNLVIDPVGAGFVESRPGGNATGFTIYEYGMGGKWVELVKEVASRGSPP
jgi:hypothetical protein